MYRTLPHNYRLLLLNIFPRERLYLSSLIMVSGICLYIILIEFKAYPLITLYFGVYFPTCGENSFYPSLFPPPLPLSNLSLPSLVTVLKQADESLSMIIIAFGLSILSLSDCLCSSFYFLSSSSFSLSSLRFNLTSWKY